MEYTDVWGYFGAIIIGLVLGLIGGGGSILTVPVMVYLFGLNPLVATAYSLFVVGITSLVGAIRNISKGLVDIRTAIIFSLPALLAVYLTRRFFIPALPDTLFQIKDFEISKEIGIMVFFALIMLIASYFMIFGNCKHCDNDEKTAVVYNYPMIVLEGLIVGFLTGIVGAGGGFLIIPALVLLAKLPMKKAVATSLLIIAIKSLIGFIGDVENLAMDWTFLLIFTLLSIGGIFLGIYLNKFIKESRLKNYFGWFVLVMAVYILYMELK